MTSEEFKRLRTQLQASTLEDPFALLADVAAGYARADTADEREARLRARDLVIRCIERGADFAAQQELLDTLIARAGLFPYLDDPDRLGLADRFVLEAHRPLRQPDDRELVFHGAQAEVYARLMDGDSVVLTAPTSFGKSVVVDALIASGRFANVVMLVPTIALIDEVRRRLTRAAGDHKIITHGAQARTDRNVFVLTQERALDLEDLPPIDLLVVDEFYKLNLDQEKDGDRSVLLNQAVYRLLRTAKQFYLLGPNIGELMPMPRRFKFFNIPSDDITVAVDVEHVGVGKHKKKKDEKAKKLERLAELVRDDLDDQTLVYCSSPGSATEVAGSVIAAIKRHGIAAGGAPEAADWVARTYHPEWILVDALRHGVGIHHGKMPRSLAHWMVSAFNDGTLRYLVCTQTLIEGVNTSAKHVVVFDGTRNRRPLDLFTFRNIQGRGGRMFQHFVGKVWLFHDAPKGELLDVDIPVLTQPEDTPEALLLEVDPDELTTTSKERLSPYLTQDLVTVEALKANPGVPLEAQLALARTFHDEPAWADTLSWKRPMYPDYHGELRPTLELLYDHFKPDQPRRRWGASSGQQMAVLINHLRPTYDPGALIAEQFQFESQRYEPQIDETILTVLTFLRTAAGFAVPRYLRVIDTLARDVYGVDYRGDLKTFAAALEGLFLEPPLAALDEYGLPPEVAAKAAHQLAPRETPGSLDETLEHLRRLPTITFSGFERTLLEEAKQDL